MICMIAIKNIEVVFQSLLQQGIIHLEFQKPQNAFHFWEQTVLQVFKVDEQDWIVSAPD